MKPRKIIKIIISVILCLALTGGVIYGLVSGCLSRGNFPSYWPCFSAKIENSPLAGKKIMFLGSSVTYGYAAFGNSFADYTEKLYGAEIYKEAVSGTTLADIKDNSYVSRLKNCDKNLSPDVFVCQLSTNDATKKIDIGEVSESYDIDEFDTKTVTGAMEYIIAYVKETYGCPVVFYTGTKYDSPEYEAMVNALYKLRDKWDITIIDLWNNDSMNSVSEKDYNLYMADSIHPTMAGYRDWWLPEFVKVLSEIV